MLRRTLNLGILAHVDAGKTTLTERLLYETGVIDAPGSVDAGSTQTDSLALERQRGITIKSAVVSFEVDDVTVNLIDTPGHPDFIAEVERVLSVLDGAVLVLSAVEGVQAQTRVLWRALQRVGVPTLLFVNKIDRAGAGYECVLERISERLTRAIVPLGGVRDIGTRAAGFTPFGPADAAFAATLLTALAEHDDVLLAAYVDDEANVPYRRLREELAAQTKRGLVHPVLFGSAATGAGVSALASTIAELLPAAERDGDGPVSGAVFKIERGAAGEKVAYVRMFSGTVRTRDRLRFGRDGERKVTAIDVVEHGTGVRRAAVSAGEIGKLWGLAEVQIGDAVGAPRTTGPQRHFPPPTLETVVVPSNPADRAALRVALGQLAEQDPLIDVRQDDARHELSVSLYGEVQKEVIQATLAADFGLDVHFRETTTICVERPVGTGAAVELLRDPENPFLAGVGLRVEPAATDAGISFRLDVEVVSIPLFVFKAVEHYRDALEDTVRRTLRQGLYGWQVRDCAVTLTHSGYVAPSSSARDFRLLTPLVLMSALREAGTIVCEPVHRFRLEAPADALGAIFPVLAQVGAEPETPAIRGSSCTVEGVVPAGRVHELRLQVPGLTRGEGVLESVFDHHRPVGGAFPTRARSDNNPLNREEYMLRLARRV